MDSSAGQRFLVKYAPVLIIGLQVALSFSGLSLGWQIAIGAVVVVLYTANHWFTVSRPFERFQRFEASKRDLLDEMARPMLEQYEDAGYELRINVMRAHRRLVVQEEPVQAGGAQCKLQFFTKRLTTEWMSPNMRQHGDRDLVFTTRQGVCGEAFESGELTFADLTDAEPESYNLNRAQIKATAQLRFVMSVPIRSIDPETERLSDAIIGVVNIDSRTNGAEQLIISEADRGELEVKAKKFAQLCARFF